MFIMRRLVGLTRCQSLVYIDKKREYSARVRLVLLDLDFHFRKMSFMRIYNIIKKKTKKRACLDYEITQRDH